MLTDVEAEARPQLRTARVALAGNPNTGKTVLFNRLTGARQRVGNYPGVTVERKVGTMTLPGRSVSVIDLPGTYSLAATSADERVVVDVLTGRSPGVDRPDLVVCVVDATNLPRNLLLASQIAETGLPVVLALNMFDAAVAAGVAIDCAKLAERFGVPVIPTVATKGRGLAELKQAIAAALSSRPLMQLLPWPDSVAAALARLRHAVVADTGQSVTDAELARLLFDEDSAVADRLDWPEGERSRAIAEARQLLHDAGLDPASAEPILRYRWLQGRLEGVIDPAPPPRARLSESIDALLVHRVFGLAIFLGVMYLVFQSIYAFAVPFMDAIDAAFGMLGDGVGGLLAATPMLRSLVADGIIAGVGGVIIFLPQILILYFFIALLEDSGYMTRAAFLMDKFFSWCGLSGKSFVPLLSSYACAVPGIMAARTIEDPKSRLVTILVAPLMSCSARLPVYVLLIGAFIEPRYGAAWAGFALFAMHFVGLLVAVPVAFVLNRVVLRTRSQPFVLEMPPYRMPRLRDLLWRMFERGKVFIVKAGTVIFAMSIVIWALCYFPRPAAVEQDVRQQFTQHLAVEQGVTQAEARALADGDLAAALAGAIEGAYIEQSYMGRMGKFAQPLFAPAGFDWKITVGVLASFPAREVIISTLGIIYDLGGDVDEESADLVATMRAATHADGSTVFTPLVAVAIMVFFALCLQCGATVATVARESSWRWAAFSFAYMTVLAWLGAVAVYQVGTAVFGPGV